MDKDQPASPAGADFESSVSDDITTSRMTGEEDKATSTHDEGITAEVEGGGVTTKTGFGDEEAAGGDKGEDDSEDDKGQEDGGEQDDKATKLPDYDPKSAEVIDQFHSKYITQDDTTGTMEPNKDALSAEYFANQDKSKDGVGSLNEATYAFLQHQFGYSKEFVKGIEEGQLALTQARDSSFYETVGGKDHFEAARAWAKGNETDKAGYSAAQRARYNKVLESNDMAAIEEASEALVARYERATGKATTQRKAPGFQRRAGRPDRSATTTAKSESGPTGFETQDEWRKARKEAIATKDDSKVEAVRRKLVVSKWYTSRRKG